MTHEEILAERQNLLAQLSPDKLEFLRNVRKKRQETTSVNIKPDDVQNEKVTEMEVDENTNHPLNKQVSFNDEVEVKEIPHKDELPEHYLPIDPKVARQWVHMDKVSNEL